MSSLKILFVADLNPYSKGFARARLLRDAGHEVRCASHTPIGGNTRGFVPLSFWDKVAIKLGRYPDPCRINDWITSNAREFAPDLVWIEKGNMIRPSTLRRLRETLPKVRIAFYSEDDMFLAHNHSRDFVAGIKMYDVIFSTKKPNANPDELPAMGARRVEIVDKAFDPKQHFPVEVTDAERAELGADVGFVGTFEQDRAETMFWLAGQGVRVRIFGNGWERFGKSHENFQVENRAVVNTEEELRFTRTICATKINLGFLRKLNRDTQTDRTMEIPACGGFMLAERSDDHLRLFEEGVEAAFFDSREELLAQVRKYLSDEPLRLKIAEAGHRRCLQSGYSDALRLEKMLGLLGAR